VSATEAESASCNAGNFGAWVGEYHEGFRDEMLVFDPLAALLEEVADTVKEAAAVHVGGVDGMDGAAWQHSHLE